MIRPGAVTLTWQEVDDVIEYSVLVKAKEGEQTLRAEENMVALATPLEPGDQLVWSVEAVTMDGAIASDPVRFEVAPDALLQELSDLEDRLNPLLASDDDTRVDAARYLMSSYCRNVGFYGEAIDHLTALAQRHPDRKELHQDLGSLYQAIGRDDLAAEAYKRALKD
jgi:tetratricopeptide (TPR) repeat protein